MARPSRVIVRGLPGITETGGKAALFWNRLPENPLAESMLNRKTDETAYLEVSRLGLEQAQAFSWQDSARRIRSFYAKICRDDEKKERAGSNAIDSTTGQTLPC